MPKYEVTITFHSQTITVDPAKDFELPEDLTEAEKAAIINDPEEFQTFFQEMIENGEWDVDQPDVDQVTATPQK